MVKRKAVKVNWCKGPPPHRGWWLTRVYTDDDLFGWRFWDAGWSLCVWEDEAEGTSPELAGKMANTAARFPPCSCVEYSDYWPANARVPRVKL